MYKHSNKHLCTEGNIGTQTYMHMSTYTSRLSQQNTRQTATQAKSSYKKHMAFRAGERQQNGSVPAINSIKELGMHSYLDECYTVLTSTSSLISKPLHLKIQSYVHHHVSTCHCYLALARRKVKGGWFCLYIS